MERLTKERALELLRSGPAGVERWNEYRDRGGHVPGLSGAVLNELNLRNVNLSWCDLEDAEFWKTDLSGADLFGAFLGAIFLEANLSGAQLGQSVLQFAGLQKADLTGACLDGAFLEAATLRETNLRSASLAGAVLSGCELTDVDVTGARFVHAFMHSNSLDADLGGAWGLDRVEHGGPSTLSGRTIESSLRALPERFLRGCGLTPGEIARAKVDDPSVPRAEREVAATTLDSLAGRKEQARPVFVACHPQERRFADRLCAELYAEGINAWRAVSRDPRRRSTSVVSDGSRCLLVPVLSDWSVKSKFWDIDLEVIAALECTREQSRRVIVPICVDDSGRRAHEAHDEMREYELHCFRDWADDSAFAKAFSVLETEIRSLYA